MGEEDDKNKNNSEHLLSSIRHNVSQALFQQWIKVGDGPRGVIKYVNVMKGSKGEQIIMALFRNIGREARDALSKYVSLLATAQEQVSATQLPTIC